MNLAPVDYLWQRLILRRRILLADQLPLGMRLRVPARDDVGRRLFKYGVHEAPVFEWLQERPAPQDGDLALDIGANLGWYSVLLDRLSAGRLDVHAFEPDTDNRALLEANLSLNGCERVTVRPEAAADQAGIATLHRYRAINRGKHSLLPIEGRVDAVEVPRTRLDDYLARSGVADRSIWLLKIDVEGLEPAVIRGMGASLDRVQALVMEYSPMYYAADDGRELLETLVNAGLKPSLREGEAWVPLSIASLLSLKDQRDTVWVRESSGGDDEVALS